MNPSDFRPVDSVTPLKRRAQDGIVYERTGEKRQIRFGDYHWCNGMSPAPEQIGPDSFLPTVAHVCPIWRVSEDQEWQPPDIPPAPQNDIDRLIKEVEYVRDTGGSDYGRLVALGSLMQAKQLERIALDMGNVSVQLWRVGDYLREIKDFLATQNRGGSTPLQTQSSGSGQPCRMCSMGEHARCTGMPPQGGVPGITYSDCRCETCHSAPDFDRHSFEGMEDNHFCTRCGGGRLHAIHSA